MDGCLGGYRLHIYIYMYIYIQSSYRVLDRSVMFVIWVWPSVKVALFNWRGGFSSIVGSNSFMTRSP